MVQDKVIRASALVISAKPYYEKDKLVTLFSASRGKILAIAKSALTLKSHLSPRLMPLTLASVTLIYARAKFPIIGGAEVMSRLRQWMLSSKRLLISSIMLSALLEVMGPREILHQFFRMVVNLLKTDPAESEEGALAMFLTRAMQILGVSGRYEACSLCAKRLNKGLVVASTDFSTLFCVPCFNRTYKGKAVYFYKFKASDVSALMRVRSIRLLSYADFKLSPHQLGLLISLFVSRTQEALPVTASNVMKYAELLDVKLPSLESEN